MTLDKLTGPSRALPQRRRRFRSLASRLVVLGVLQLVLLAGTAIIIFIAEGPHEPAEPADHIAPTVIHRLEGLVDTPVALQSALDQLHDDRIEVSLYDAKRQLLASNVDPPLAIPTRRGRPRFPALDGPPRDDSDQPRPDAPPDGVGSDQPRPDGTPPESVGSDRPRRDDPPRDVGSSHRRPDRDRAPGGSDVPRSGDRGPVPGADHPPFPPHHDVLGGEPPPPFGDPPPNDDRPPPGFDGGPHPHRMLIRIRVGGELGFLVARGLPGEPPGLTGPLLTLTCGFVILVLGALLTARWIVRPIDRLSRTARALGAGDLAARSQLGRSDEIGELGHRIDEMADRIEGLLVTEKELIANVAHELRTPLTRIGVALDLAGEGDAEAARASLAEIAVDVSELETIVDDILTAMRFEIAGTTKLPLRRAVVEPRTIAEATADRLRSRHPTRSIAVTVAADLPGIDVDPVLFRRVIDNLVENAHKYSPDGTAPIDLEVSRDGDEVTFVVRDRGIGITAEDLPRVFTAFFRGDRSRSRESGGVGLGLTLAKRIVDAHGGSISVASDASTGTTVRVSVPAVV